MKKQNLNHMDIKPCNILITWDFKETYKNKNYDLK